MLKWTSLANVEQYSYLSRGGRGMLVSQISLVLQDLGQLSLLRQHLDVLLLSMPSVYVLDDAFMQDLQTIVWVR